MSEPEFGILELNEGNMLKKELINSKEDQKSLEKSALLQIENKIQLIWKDVSFQVQSNKGVQVIIKYIITTFYL